MTTALLSTAYFGPVQWYQKLYRFDRVLVDIHETFQKQTYRNRCHIAAAQGVQTLTVPVEHQGGNSPTASVRISDHGNWRHQHWQAVSSAYGDSPFFEYYEDDLRPFFFSNNWERLVDFNRDICQTICHLIDFQPTVESTQHYMTAADLQEMGGNTADFRRAIRPKHPDDDLAFTPLPYWQVFSQRHGFLPNMSILDLLCNMGPESILYL